MLRSSGVQATVFTGTSGSCSECTSLSPRSDYAGSMWSEYPLEEKRDFSQQWPVPPAENPAHEHACHIEVQKKKEKCLFCRKMRPGEDHDHNQQTCIFAFQDKCSHSLVDCPRGIHLPYLHGVWRCTWCGCHMKDYDVWLADKELWEKSWEREQANREKHNGEPAKPWQ